jgi:hypothetical protein
MSTTPESNRPQDLKHQLDRILADSVRFRLDWADQDHRPLIDRFDAAKSDPDPVAKLQAMTLDFLEESGATDADLMTHIASAAKAIDNDASKKSGGHRPPFSRELQSLSRAAPYIYATRKANALEILTTVEPILRRSCKSPIDLALQASLTRLETLAAIIVEKIDNLGQTETIGASLLYRGDIDGRFLASPLYTSVELQPDICAYSASHLVRVLNEEVRRVCRTGRVAYVANTDALVYKAVVQMTAHCQFRSLYAAPSTTDADPLCVEIGVGRRANCTSRDEDVNWLKWLLGRTRDDPTHPVFDVAISSVPSMSETPLSPVFKSKLTRRLRNLFGDFAPRSENNNAPSAPPPAQVCNLIEDALMEQPSRRVFAAADGERTVWTADDALTGSAP